MLTPQSKGTQKSQSSSSTNGNVSKEPIFKWGELCGVDGWVEIEEFGKAKEAFF
jgi:hypothetical protein